MPALGCANGHGRDLDSHNTRCHIAVSSLGNYSVPGVPVRLRLVYLPSGKSCHPLDTASRCVSNQPSESDRTMPDIPQAQTARPRANRSARKRGNPVPPPKDLTIVGIGASAGGLEACGKLLDALPTPNGMAFILVQHLDPTHESMMVDLLARHTSMVVTEATDGTPIVPDHLYVIPPGKSLAVANGALHLSQPQERHGARLPFDFLLHSMAASCGRRAICVVLSGTGSDGALGLRAIKEKDGYVIAQDPGDAAYDGMPRSAIATNAVDLVVPVARIPAALIEHDRDADVAVTEPPLTPQEVQHDAFVRIIDLVRTKTRHDFRLYKAGTLQRRIERRMAMAGIGTDDTDRYFTLLQSSSKELDDLAQDLLINVTDFFRDPKVFDVLQGAVVPDLIRALAPDQPIRIWVAGCSTGEEAYSLAMVFREQFTAAKRDVRLQIFASDVDPDAVGRARDGIYPGTIEAAVSSDRLARFFVKEGESYRVSPELRSDVVFTIQDVLVDPPFSRLDFVSCRNLLIYLRPEAQEKVLSIFHFALRDGGILLLGNSETVGSDLGRHFEIINKSARLYRRVGHGQPAERAFPVATAGNVRVPARSGPGPVPPRQIVLAELCRRLLLENYAPAAVLIDRKRECLYAFGPTDRYLRVPPGAPTHDLLSMAREGLRAKLGSAIQQAEHRQARVVAAGGLNDDHAHTMSFRIEIHPITHEGEKLLLVCFVDEPTQEQRPSDPIQPEEMPRVVALEQELEAAKTELRSAVRDLEISSEEQKAINEEALSVNEEYQSTNEELVTSKEELQSLNEELTALNSQLHETLDRQRTTFNDLQNVLFSTDVATIFLDTRLNIRLFTPATKSLFGIIPSDIGRPLMDLQSLAPDDALLADARTVMRTSVPIERESQARNDAWFIRRILPYRTQDDKVEGVVITFVDITDRRKIAEALDEARQDAERANVAKSRFLAAASHDLRQPLQTLVLIQGLLARTIKSGPARKLVVRLDESLGAMAGMLNTLLDINQIEAGNVQAETVDFSINDILERLRHDFTFHAQAKGLTLRVVACHQTVRSDPRLLEQILRNLLSNALKYTEHGKILLGCRRRNGMLSIDVCDTGIGIAHEELQAIFEEYHQLDNPARKRERGLGLGLSIANRLAKLLDHSIRVRSHPGKGSVFSISVMLPTIRSVPRLMPSGAADRPSEDVVARRAGVVLVIEDDAEMRELIELVLTDEGHSVTVAPDGVAALALLSEGGLKPDLVLSDYNLPNDLNGLEVAAKLREALRWEVPVVILTGDISTSTLREITAQKCKHLNKPVKLQDLTGIVQQLLPLSGSVSQPAVREKTDTANRSVSPVIFVVDDDSRICSEMRAVLEDVGYAVEDYADGEAFLEGYRPGREGCLLIDAYLPGMDGIQLLRRLQESGRVLPSIMITGYADIPMAVAAMKAGAIDFIEKPVSREELLVGIGRALEQARDSSKFVAWQESAATRIAELTERQRDIMDMVLAGHPSKNIAADLGISQRTVENHRAAIMKRTGCKSVPALARLALAAETGRGTVTAPVAPLVGNARPCGKR